MVVSPFDSHISSAMPTPITGSAPHAPSMVKVDALPFKRISSAYDRAVHVNSAPESPSLMTASPFTWQSVLIQ